MRRHLPGARPSVGAGDLFWDDEEGKEMFVQSAYKEVELRRTEPNPSEEQLSELLARSRAS